MASPEFLNILQLLHAGGVEFILVGGLATILQGAPINTFDVDVVHNRERANLDRLLPVLEDLNAVYRNDPGRRLHPKLSHLESPGHQNLTTRLGPLDLLGTVGVARSLAYADLLPHSPLMEVGTGVRIPVLDLAQIIALKVEVGGLKDLAVLPILRQTLKERNRL